MDERNSPDASSDAQGHALCLACGACCNGLWFPHINLQPEEAEPARRAGFPIRIVDGSARAPQPCRHHHSEGCSIYDSWRPAACVGYRCKLLVDVTEGRVLPAEALQHIGAIKAMAQRIREQIPQLPAGVLSRHFLEGLGGEDLPAGAPEVSPSARLDAVALNLYYQKHFHVPRGDRATERADRPNRPTGSGR
jgi:hypothetical protein